MAVLDTNVIIRYLTEDDAVLAARALRIIEEVEAGTRSIVLPEGVLVEVVQVLSSSRLYNVAREIIRARVSTIIRLPHLQLPNKRTYLAAFDLYVEHPRLSFVDALCIAHAQRTSDSAVVSFDEGFRNLPGVTWERP